MIHPAYIQPACLHITSKIKDSNVTKIIDEQRKLYAFMLKRFYFMQEGIAQYRAQRLLYV